MAEPLDSRVEEILQGGNPPLLSRIEKLLKEGGAGGGVSPEQIAAAVEAYLDEHGVTVTETDPTVPEWAKAETKPSYTATEVGALPSNTYIPPDAVWCGEWNISGQYNVGDFVSYNDAIYRCEIPGIGIYPDEEQGWVKWFDASTIGAYTKPAGGIPKSDLADDVKTSLGKADTALQQHQSLAGYATESYVRQQIDAIPDELPAVSSSDNGKFLRVILGAWAAASVPSAESNSFGGGA